MKKLQNNFTTPEQSKRLLELGVPADSADCIYPCYKQDGEGDKQIMYGYINIKQPAGSYPKCFIPSWSAGRLVEIMLNSQIDTGRYTLGFMLDKDTFSIESLIEIIDEDIEEFDFSKLDE